MCIYLFTVPIVRLFMHDTDIWYNKWAGGDREDSYSKCVLLS